ncbi:MAG: hypothetical protein WC980_07560 [Candidatus Brocadiia bacterium]
MSLKDSDFLEWYNNEIFRYRDMEWRLASYSMVISSGILLFAKSAETSKFIEPVFLACAMGFFILVLFIAEIYAHKRLNEFRMLRDLLLEEKTHQKIDTPIVKLILNSWDALYFAGFTVLPLLFGLGAILILYFGN